MIYAIGDLCTPIKNIFGPQAYSIKKTDELCDKMQIDPSVSNITAVVLSTNFLRGIAGQQLIQAIRVKHSKVVIVLFYKGTESHNGFEEIEDLQLPNVFVHSLTKVSDTSYIKRCIEEDIEKAVMVGNIDLPQTAESVTSPIGEFKDVLSPSDPWEGTAASNKFVIDAPPAPPYSPMAANAVIPENPLGTGRVPTPPRNNSSGKTRRVKHVEYTPGGMLDVEAAKVKTVDTWDIPSTQVDIPMGTEILKVNFEEYERPSSSMRERFQAAASKMDSETIGSMLSNSEVTRELMRENKEYISAQLAVDLLTKEITAIFSDSNIAPKDRMEKVRAICAKKSDHQAVLNQEYVKSLLDVMDSITQAATESAKAVREEYKVKFATPEISDLYYSNKDKLEELSTNRFNAQLELVEIVNRLRGLYLTMDKHASQTVQELKDQPLTSSALVNESLRSVKEMFAPVNRESLIRSIMSSLSNKRASFSQVELDLNDLMDSLFKLFDLTNDFTNSRETMVQLLSASRVEELVVCDNLVKYKLHTIIGPDNVGKTATAVSIATALSRTDNVLLIDLSAASKLDRYIRAQYTLTEFYDIQTKDSLTVVKRSKDCVYNSYKLQEAIKASLPHYKRIYVLLSTNDIDEYDDLKKMSCTVNFVTNATLDKLEEVKPLTAEFDEDNTSLLLTLINCASGEMDIVEMLGIDPLRSGLRKVPFFEEVQRAALRHKNPCDSEIVRDYFIEHFS